MERERADIERSESEAVLETRRELGPQYDAALVDSFADRIERAVEARVAADLAQRQSGRQADAGAGKRQTALGIVSLVAGIPVSAITLAVPNTDEGSLLSLVVAWAGIVGVNIAHARRRGSQD
jgi:hypothetical protein